MWASEVLEAPVGQYALPKVDLSAVMIFSEATSLNLPGISSGVILVLLLGNVFFILRKIVTLDVSIR